MSIRNIVNLPEVKIAEIDRNIYTREAGWMEFMDSAIPPLDHRYAAVYYTGHDGQMEVELGTAATRQEAVGLAADKLTELAAGEIRRASKEWDREHEMAELMASL